jgi:hypothetical protein
MQKNCNNIVFMHDWIFIDDTSPTSELSSKYNEYVLLK